MKHDRFRITLSLIAVLFIFTAACKKSAPPTASPQSASNDFIFGMLLVSPYNDHGWSQAHYEAGKYVEKKLPGTKMLYIDKVNPADRPGTTPAQLAEDLFKKGAKLIIFNSEDMKEDALEFARKHPNIFVIHASGDSTWKEGKEYISLPNLVNIMGRMEFGKMIAGCAAALTTKTGRIGYLGPLINDESRRLTASSYLGAKYCWTNLLGKDPKDLSFLVTWIGFWFNIPGVTADPTQVCNDFFNGGFDVVLSGIDTSEALVQAKKIKAAGKEVAAVAYDYIDACDEAPNVCLGVSQYNWGPAYLKHVKAVIDGNWKSVFEWNGPYWPDINDPDKSAVGFKKGPALNPDVSAKLDEFIKALAKGLNLWKGPLNLQNGTLYLKDGEIATDRQVWYLPQLLQGMEGQSISK